MLPGRPVRRQFIAGMAMAFAGRTLYAQNTREIEVRLNPAETPGETPVDFLGLGYEISSAATAGLFKASNKSLLPFMKTLAPRGTIRIGGNTSDFAVWSPGGTPTPLPKGTVTTAESMSDLGGWLSATGWDLIWGVNLGTGMADAAADQVAVLAASAGKRLHGIEVGNEPDLFVPQGHRKAGYGYADFRAEFDRFAAAIARRTPGVRFAGPDVAAATDWVANFARDEGKHLALLTQHYYAAGPPDSPGATISNLLRTDEGFVRMIRQLRQISLASGIPYRLVEVNSCFGGGKPGMSDTFASALWGLDLMFTLADAGGAGINWQTGVNHLGFISSYSPVWDDQHSHYSARPLYYALLAFSIAGLGKRIPATYDAGNVNLRAWAAMDRNGSVWLTLINKDLTQEANVRVRPMRKFERGEALELTAPAVEAKEGVTLGGASVSTDGTWRAVTRRGVRISRDGEFRWRLDPAAAVLIRLGSLQT